MRATLQAVWSYTAVRFTVILLLAFALLWFLFRTRQIWIVLLLSLLVANLARPLVTWSARRLRAPWLGVLVFLMGVFLLVGLTSYVAVALVGQGSSFAADLPGLLDEATALSGSLLGFLNRLNLSAPVENIFNNAYQSLGRALETLAERLVTGLGDLVTSGQVVGGVSVVVGDIIQFFAFLAITIYLMLDLPRVQASLLRAVPVPYQGVAQDLSRKLNESVGGYFRGQLLIALVVGVVTGAGLALLQVPLALFIGVLAGVFNLVPYLGVVVSAAPAFLLALPQGWLTLLGVLVVFTVANQLETHVLSPVILGRSTRLHPVTVIVAILLGASLFGLLGAIFAVPLAAFLKLVLETYYLDSRLHRKG